jgi:hypothetical protein
MRRAEHTRIDLLADWRVDRPRRRQVSVSLEPVEAISRIN